MTFCFDMVVVRASNSLIDMRYDDYSFWIKQSRIEMGARVGNYLIHNCPGKIHAHMDYLGIFEAKISFDQLF